MDNRTSKQNYYLDIADSVLERSTCLRRKYGAIIVRNDEIISTGYNGYAPEAVQALTELCFARGEEEIFCAHADWNRKSRRVIEKCGFHYLGDALWLSSLGDVRNCCFYSIRREDRQA